MRPIRSTLLLALALLVAGPAMASYVIFLKDGTRLVTEAKYRVVGDKAVMTLQNGTTVSHPVSQIDVERTEKANESGLGSAVMIEGGQKKEVNSKSDFDQQKRLSDLISTSDAGLRRLPESRRQVKPQTQRTVSQTPAGYPDLLSLPREPFQHLEVSASLQQAFVVRNIEGVGIFRGLGGDRPMIEVPANSEASVFKAMVTAAKALLDTRERYPDLIDGIDLLMITSNNKRAGQFTILPEMATALMGGQIEPSQFFIKYVQF